MTENYESEAMKKELEQVARERRHVPHLPVLLLLDVSLSMKDEPIAELNRIVQSFRNEVKSTPETRARMDISVMSYDSTPRIVTPFSSVDNWQPKDLAAGGSTNTAEAMVYAAEYLSDYNRELNEAGIEMYRPIIVHITDGASTSTEQDTENAVALIQSKMQKNNKGTNRLKLWNFFVTDKGSVEDLSKWEKRCLHDLNRYSPFTVLAKNRNYADIFDWLAVSFQIISSSQLAFDANGDAYEPQMQAPEATKDMTAMFNM